MDPKNYIIKYLDTAQLMQVATSVDNQPWACSVYFAMDNAHSLYWLSRPDTEHSQSIAINPVVAGTVVLPPTYGEPVQGLQFAGTARQIPDEELEAAFEAYAEKFGAHSRLAALRDGSDPHRLYQIKPVRFVLFDELNFPDDPRQEWVILPPAEN